MKKIFSILTVAVLSFSLVACGGGEKPEGGAASSSGLKDGTYSAEAEEYSDNDWKPKITLVVSDGKITSVDWNESNPDGDDKKAQGEEYGMKAAGSELEWFEQAALAEEELVKIQDPIELNDIAGVSMDISDFKTLSIQALNDAK